MVALERFCSSEVIFNGQCHCAGEIFLPVERGSHSLEVPLLEVRQYIYNFVLYFLDFTFLGVKSMYITLKTTHVFPTEPLFMKMLNVIYTC